ncbi:energy-coupling factor transporter transmembrane component T [Neobacillus sp. SM06]|uniref:energy-coupling factor transporter transmembrane component T n=1 Tax=Neobacillus sp. SM06 TaxID=3422492 RepID=UPI003D276521
MYDRFERFHPLILFIYYGGAMILFFLLLHPLFLSIAFFLVLLLHLLRDHGRSLSQWLFFMLTTGLFLFLLNPLFNERGRHVLLTIFQHRFTLEAFIYGGMSALSVMGVIALFVSYNEIMTPNKLLFLFAKWLPQFAVLLMLTLRFIPLMKKRAEDITAIQKSKGIAGADGSLRKRIETGLLFLQALLVFSLEEAIQTADSMNARGYGFRKRSSYEYFVLKKADWIAGLFLVFLFIAIAYGRVNGYGYLTVYPRLENWYLTGMDLEVLIFECLYLSFPLMVNVGRRIRWRILR